jgi:hypothetical protein
MFLTFCSTIRYFADYGFALRKKGHGANLFIEIFRKMGGVSAFTMTGMA